MILRRLGQGLAGLLVLLVLAAIVTARSGDPALYPAPDDGSQNIEIGRAHV